MRVITIGDIHNYIQGEGQIYFILKIRLLKYFLGLKVILNTSHMRIIEIHSLYAHNKRMRLLMSDSSYVYL